jgi:hypothetical protein
MIFVPTVVPTDRRVAASAYIPAFGGLVYR